MEYIKGKRYRHSKRLRFFCLLFACLFASGLALALFLHNVVNPVIISVSQSQLQSQAAMEINGAVLEVLGNNLSLSDVLIVERDDQNRITNVLTNSLKINLLQREIIAKTQTNIGSLAGRGVSIPIGTLSGITALSGMGSEVVIKTLSVQSVTGDFVSSFASAGINQTKYSLYAKIAISITLILAGSIESFNIDTEILLLENIIIGEVPAAIITLGAHDGALNLVP